MFSGCLATDGINPIMSALPQQTDNSRQDAGDQDVVVSPQADARLVERRLRVNLDALRHRMASTPIEPPGPFRTLLDELRWRRQVRRSWSRGMTPISVMVFLFLCWLMLLAAIVIVKIVSIGWLP
jgi:hypothetical protein